MYPTALRIFLVLLCTLSFMRLSAQCNPDVTPPVAICDAALFVSLAANGEATIVASIIDDGSYDLCCLDTILVRRQVDGPCDDDAILDDFSGSVSFCCADVGAGPVTIVLQVSDCAGNTNLCWTDVTVDDKLSPALLAPANVTISSVDFAALNIDINDTAQMNMAFGAPSVFDNCSLPDIDYTVTAEDDDCGTPSSITRQFAAADVAGNTVKATQIIRVLEDYTLHVPADFYAGDPVQDSMRIVQGGGLVGFTYSDEVFTADCYGPHSRINRTWGAINWCGFDPGTAPLELPKLDMDNDGRPGDAYDVLVLTDSIYLLENGNPTIALGARTEFYQYLQLIRQSPADTLDRRIAGTVFLDVSGDCEKDANESIYPGAKVIITGLVSGESFTITPNILGAYYQSLCTEDTLVEVTLDLPWNYGSNCPTTYVVPVRSSQVTTLDIPVSLVSDCPLLTVDLSTSILRRCFSNVYTVQACNFSTDSIENVYVEVDLDDYFDYTGSSVAGTALGNNLYSFDVGTLASGDCTSFQIYFDLNCDAPLGFTHCTDAHVYPDTICNPPPAWSGANVAVQALCDGDSVRLSIQNNGSGDMAQPLDFVVVEDVIMFQSGTFQLNSGLNQDLAVMANGATWRIEAEQEGNHPWGGVAAVAMEGCGGLNTPGLVNMFPLNFSNPFAARDCRENIGSWDPNDKQAFPRGYGSEHFIKANTDLEYLIRFQNTGSDTAFTVVVLDTLSSHLDISTIRPGVSSHPYEFAILDGNVLRFRFDNILLPDSNVNEVASHGFVKFGIAQKLDNPDGTRLENSAAIFFDFNDPVITNTAFHTIGDHFVLVHTNPGPIGLPNLKVYPNPGSEMVYFEMPTAVSKASFTLTNAYGQRVRQDQFSGIRYQFERGELTEGVYFYQISQNETISWSGKILLR